ncbi:hypothetical protein UFOVP729_6 [uncultured Caudovirales phage]|uniref:Uncharacterized protein n=1 Tax=uncultured Caudovirales phage TaxID=2100421 RepID=A0A6J5NPF0_9CAUD|nr:hypothetical protein UFOVP729_6 [uncultured Caudovirales phage]
MPIAGYRITEGSDTRFLENGDTRVTEGFQTGDASLNASGGFDFLGKLKASGTVVFAGTGSISGAADAVRYAASLKVVNTQLDALGARTTVGETSLSASGSISADEALIAVALFAGSGAGTISATARVVKFVEVVSGSVEFLRTTENDDYRVIENPVYENISFSVATEETNPQDLFFSSDGTKMFVIGSTGDDINEYTLSTPWVVSSASYSTVFSIAARDTSPTGLFFRADGLKMYFTGGLNDRVYQYTLGTAWSIATASFDSVSFSVTTQDTGPTALSFKPDGLSMYVLGTTNDSVYQYTLSTAWNVSTASFLQSFSVAGQSTGSNGLSFTSNGLKMFVLDTTDDDVYQYSLSTAWDVSTAVLDGLLLDLSAQGSSPLGLYVKSDGTKLYTVDSNSDVVYQYNIINNRITNLVPTNEIIGSIVANDTYIPFSSTAYYKTGGVWKQTDVDTKYNGNWDALQAVYKKISGNWKRIY